MFLQRPLRVTNTSCFKISSKSDSLSTGHIGLVQPTHQGVPLLQILRWTWRPLLHRERCHTSHPPVRSSFHRSPRSFLKASILCLSFSFFFKFSCDFVWVFLFFLIQQDCGWQKHRGHFCLTAGEHSRVRQGCVEKAGTEGGSVTPWTGQSLLPSDSYIWKSGSASTSCEKTGGVHFLGGVTSPGGISILGSDFPALSIW